MPRFMGRDDAAKRICAEGVPITAQTLADQACDGRGPKFAIINGRALYTEADLLKWIAREASKTPAPRRRTRQQRAS